MTPSIMSVNIAESVEITRTPLAGPLGAALSRIIRAQNPHIEFFDSAHWGYSVLEFTREGCTYTGYSVDSR